MRRLVASLVLTLLAVVAGTAPAHAGPHRHINWGPANWAAGVQMFQSEPSKSDPHVHVRFKRVGGVGLREVRMGEREKVPGAHQWGPYHYTDPVQLDVGQKVVFTTEGALPCEPAREPLGITIDLRIKKPGQPWNRWQTYVTADYFLLDCAESRQALVATPPSAP